MKEKKVASLKIVFEDGSDYSVACEKGLDKDELAEYIERAFRPAEPLIKDEKIRKAVRAWAEYNGIKRVVYIVNGGGGSCFFARVSGGLSFELYNQLYGVNDDKDYTITELCGEEEE